MSCNYCEKINELLIKSKNNAKKYPSRFKETAIKTSELLLEIFDNKNSDEIDNFFNTHILNFKFKEKYMHFYKKDYFESFKDTNDIIDKLDFKVNDEEFYKEFNEFLTSILHYK